MFVHFGKRTPRTGPNKYKGSNPTQQRQTPKKHPELKDGNGKQQSPFTRPSTKNSKRPSLQPDRPCYNSKVAPSPAAPSPPYFIEFEYPSHLKKNLLLRRLRLRFPLSARSCRCHRRPPRGTCSVRNITSQRRPFPKGSNTHLQRRGGQSHHQYPTTVA